MYVQKVSCTSSMIMMERFQVCSQCIHRANVVNSIPVSIATLLLESGVLVFNKPLIAVLTSIAGIWNLDFFRLVYEPFSLHPNMTTLHIQAP